MLGRRELIFLLTLITSQSFSLLKASTICQQLCPNISCCETKLGVFECCPYINGICCRGGKFCCPQGSSCSEDTLTCHHPGGLFTSLSLWKPATAEVSKSIDSPNSPVICPDRISACSNGSTCCSLKGGSWGCCNWSNAVCCDDNLHCCPQGTKCNNQRGSCDPVISGSFDKWAPALLGSPFWPKLGEPRISAFNVTTNVLPMNKMSYAGVKCDDKYECPLETTCCREANGAFACCPMPEAICCSDHIHCCPKNTRCDVDAGKCIGNTNSQSAISKIISTTPPVRDGPTLCPDGHSMCGDAETCCKLSDKTFGCCPVPEAVCCSDGEHCCPAGFTCNYEKKTCVKSPVDHPKNEVICPNHDFRCNGTSTCCPLPNNEWACCPMKDAVCCPDMAHCCPRGSQCDVKHNKCIQIHSNDVTTSSVLENVCPDRLVACPGGTCCKGVFGIYACCPLPNAVCCGNGRCCPKGTTCNPSNGGCTRSSDTSISTPWLSKLPPRARELSTKPEQTTVTSNSTLAGQTRDHVCSDQQSICEGDRTCCLLVDGSFGCCPLPNGTCCSDRHHCCPSGSSCSDTGQCIRHLPSVQSIVYRASQMFPVIKTPVELSRVLDVIQTDEVIHAKWCGLCPHDMLCCPNAVGLPNRKCCPISGGVCCPDGEYCCPQGSRCLGHGKCVSHNRHVELSAAPYLIAAKHPSRPTVEFLHHSIPRFIRAPSSHKSRLDPAFLLDMYYQQNAHRFNVCPDRERVCPLDERCCLSRKRGYVCAPIRSTCCHIDADTYCPSGSTCSSDGHSCHEVIDSHNQTILPAFT